MPLTRDQRLRLAYALKWSRDNGWKQGAWNHTWHNDVHWVAYDSVDTSLVVDSMHPTSPLGRPLAHRLRRAKVHVENVDQALDVLTALGLLHPALSPMVNRCVEESVEPASGQPDVCANDFDGPVSFTEAGEAFADLVNGVVAPRRAAEVLSELARSGLIVSAEYADEITDELAVDRRLAELGGDMADLAMVVSGGHYVPLDQEQQ